MGGQGEAVALVEAEVEVGVVGPRNQPQTGVVVVAEALKVRKREELEVEEGTSYLVEVEGLPRPAGKAAVVEVQRWGLWTAAAEERLFPWLEGEEGLSYVEGEEEAAALPSTVVEVAVLAFAVHF